MTTEDKLFGAIQAAVAEYESTLTNLRADLKSRNETILGLETAGREAISARDSRIIELESSNRQLRSQWESTFEKLKSNHELAIEELDTKVAQLSEQNSLLVSKWDGEVALLKQTHEEAIASKDADVISVKRQHDAFINKSTHEIDMLNAEIKRLVSEHDAELAHWQREHRRVAEDLEKRTNEFIEELKERNDSVAELSEKYDKSLREHESYVKLIRLDQENAASVHSGELEKLRNQLQGAQSDYQEERKVTKRIWGVLGYDIDKDSPPKPIHELINDKDQRIVYLEKSRESAVDKYSDQITDLNLQIGTLEMRQEAMQSTIAHYKGLKDVSDLAVRLLDTLEREQWAGNKEALGEIIAEGRQIVLAAR